MSKGKNNFISALKTAISITDEMQSIFVGCGANASSDL